MERWCTWLGASGSEVKTLIMGEVTRNKRGEVCTQHFLPFRGWPMPSTLTQASLVETHRRGLERARAVCAVQDGAEWLQGLVDYHRADAVRILDFAHAAEYINEIGQAVQAAGGRLPAWWFEAVLPPAETSGTRARAQAPELVGRTLSQCQHSGETGLFAETRGAHAVPHLSGKQAGPLARAVWKVPTRWSSKHG